MDLQLVLRVLWRFRTIVALGLIVATSLAVVSYYQVSLDGGKPSFTPRQSEKWESLGTLFVTSRGFPWGSIGTGPSEDEAVPTDKDQGLNPSGLDPVHLTALAALYVRLSTSDPVLEVMKRDGPVNGQLQAFPVASDDNGDGSVLPMVTLSAISTSPQEAKRLAERHAKAFVRFIEQQQTKARIPSEERVEVQIARAPQGATMLEGRKKTRPMVVFIAVMLAVIGLTFSLENLRPRIVGIDGEQLVHMGETGVPAPAPASRRSA